MVQHAQYFRVIVLQYERQRDEEIEHVALGERPKDTWPVEENPNE